MIDRPKPYVGVSGVVNPEQQRVLLDASTSLRSQGHRLNLGVKAVHKTQWLDINNKYGRDWYPVGDEISDAIRPVNAHDNTMVTAQVFLDFKAAEGEQNYAKRFVSKMMGRTGHYLTAVQFDLLPWAHGEAVDMLEFIKDYDSDLEIILQCYGPLMEQYSPDILMKRFRPYHEIVDHLLFDASHGTGTRLNPAVLEPYIDKASELPWLGVGVAGGLDAKVVREDLPALIMKYPHLSIDAEGRLHRNSDIEDKSLNIGETIRYITEAEKLVSSRFHP